MVVVVDYGMGNIHSVNKALQLYGAKTLITNKPEDILSAEKLVLPGVGAFGDAMSGLRKQGLVSVLKKYICSKKPFLGVCLGMQLLFEESEETAKSRGLGILKGKVIKLKEKKRGQKVPHMGWDQLKKVKEECPLLKDIPDNSYVYFCHSYYPKPRDENIIAGVTDYGVVFASMVWQDNIYGVQFHPEKSQKTGLKIIENFVSLC